MLQLPQEHQDLKPIDSIYISENIQIEQGGYTPFDMFNTNHCLIWFDISSKEAFDHDPNDILLLKARRLNYKTQILWNTF